MKNYIHKNLKHNMLDRSYIHKTKMKGVTFNYFGRHQCLKKEASSLKCNHACFT